ncbi:MAG: hypothetical protein GY906_04290 [bacterium]|nr:hypothetical protein [bacterium]
MRFKNVQVAIGLLLIVVAGAVPGYAADPVADNGTTVADPPPVGTMGDVETLNNPWVTIPACPVGVSRPAGAVVGGIFYVIGGEESGGARSGFVQAYDPTTTTWDNTNATMNSGASNITAAVIGTDIYIPAGYDGSYLSTMQVYHSATDTWETIATDPVPAALSGPTCTASGGLVYVFGGNDGSAYQTTTYIYDPAAAAGSRWSSGAAIPVAGGYGSAIANGGYIYYAGIRDSVGDLDDVLRYDVAGDSWTAMPSLTTARGGARMWVYEGLLAVGGGGWGSYYNTVEEYDLSTGTGGTWTSGNSLVTGRRTFAAAQDYTTGVLYTGAGWAGAFLTAAESSIYVVPVELMSFSVE